MTGLNKIKKRELSPYNKIRDKRVLDRTVIEGSILESDSKSLFRDVANIWQRSKKCSVDSGSVPQEQSGLIES